VAKAKGKATKSALLANSAGSGEEEVKSNEEDTSKEPAET
jgi:hypothetical protein